MSTADLSGMLASYNQGASNDLFEALGVLHRHIGILPNSDRILIAQLSELRLTPETVKLDEMTPDQASSFAGLKYSKRIGWHVASKEFDFSQEFVDEINSIVIAVPSLSKFRAIVIYVQSKYNVSDAIEAAKTFVASTPQDIVFMNVENKEAEIMRLLKADGPIPSYRDTRASNTPDLNETAETTEIKENKE